MTVASVSPSIFPAITIRLSGSCVLQEEMTIAASNNMPGIILIWFSIWLTVLIEL
ncbi:MAG: hypothetical protein EA408_11215 [Marinilabiliales bacterium]|nr:MAG: hypothetical protein EA408_11215 [Marinilabiliales bacterium]